MVSGAGLTKLIKSKGSAGRLQPMNRATRHHVTRRSVALERLETITATAAIAGVAGTIGFGTLAAVTFSGTANAADELPQQNVTLDRGEQSGPSTEHDDGDQPFLAAPPPQTSSRRGHATTGGSG